MNIRISETNSVWLNTTATKFSIPAARLVEVIFQMLREHTTESEPGQEPTSIEDWVGAVGKSHTMSAELLDEFRNTASAAEEAINATHLYINIIERNRK